METISLIPENSVSWVLASIGAAACLVQVLFYLIVMRKVSRPFPTVHSSRLPAVSVVVCAKNEAANLSKFLPIILTQDYPQFEVVVVNDASTDDSDMVLAQMKISYPNLYYTTIPVDRRFLHSKKLAVNIGIKAAKYEHLLFTDADCMPESDHWIRLMMSGFASPGKELVVGYSPYARLKGMLNCWVRYETFWNGLQYLGFALMGKAYMGVGRNMAYTKSLFQRNSGFSRHVYLASGDDDLFVRDAATPDNVAVVVAPGSKMRSQPVTSWGNWMMQKARHLSTAPLYQPKFKFLLSCEPVSRELLWGIALYSVIFNTFAAVGAGLLLVKLLIQLVVLGKGAKKLEEGKIYWSSLLFDFIIPIILGYIYVRNYFRPNRIKWK
ncbi:cellulose synthase/poly-beta-1,6-N-acetylglucosamine synthase-like glycosyltransferase [Breznakibacter xylanolyticus]|uniref:Cellulose synthase/poly-beta-1,6-N-acetylglucosamine synthase-like glycosyltransferase n=1 Tax=Breznakibacter xylanolyticus TaxID=990 RepID=A0A2W7NK13_9BACT|nr:glycosyltransferase [Breznakibacter xylanolyticus]PZX20765.1 cellulose synthase/poly-beta-1,6-N-acetylglucosamine synthase-like glycosyltransferase [Breznakibacter xylanolyticus]